MSEINNRERLKVGAKTRILEIALGPAGFVSSITLDGELVRNCRAVSFRARAGEVTTVTLELINVAVLVEGRIGVTSTTFTSVPMDHADLDEDDDDPERSR